MTLQDNIAKEFDEFSKNYTEDMTCCVPHYLKLLSSFTEDLPTDFIPTKILDLGCGNGNVTSHLVKVYPQAHYSLLDASNEMLSLCKKKFNNYSIEGIEAYFQDYNFPLNEFDLIVAGFSLHHCNQEDKQLLFKHIFKSLKKGGVFSCSDLMIDKRQIEHVQLLKDWDVFVNANYTSRDKWNWIMEHYDEYDKPDSLQNQLEWLKQAGFKNFKITLFDGYWAHLKAFK